MIVDMEVFVYVLRLMLFEVVYFVVFIGIGFLDLIKVV